MKQKEIMTQWMGNCEFPYALNIKGVPYELAIGQLQSIAEKNGLCLSIPMEFDAAVLKLSEIIRFN